MCFIFWLCCVFILCCYTRTFSSHGEPKLLFVWRVGCSLCWALPVLPEHQPWLSAHRLGHCSTWAQQERRVGSAAVAHQPSGSAECESLREQGLHLHPLHWQVDSQPLDFQGNPGLPLLNMECILLWGIQKQLVMLVAETSHSYHLLSPGI